MLKSFNKIFQILHQMQIVIKVLVYCSIFINFSFASRECTPETPWNCQKSHKRGGVNIALTIRHLKKLVDIIEKKSIVGREFEDEDIREHLYYVKHEKQEIPESFDARRRWPMCKSLSQIQNQQTCGTCWAFATGSAVSDRLCIASEGRQQFRCSEQDVITCCHECYPSNYSSRCLSGASLIAPVMYIIKYGVVYTKCKPYDITTLEDGCKQRCINTHLSYNKRKLNMSSIGFAWLNSEQKHSTIEDVQIEIMKNGPVTTCLVATPPDLTDHYTDEVYISKESDPEESGHGVKVLGWGTENGVPYWLCANSWGKNWGKLGGFFKLRRGTNELGIENFFVASNVGPGVQPPTGIENDEDNDYSSNVMGSRKTLQMYKIAIVVVMALHF